MQLGDDLQNVWMMFNHVKHVQGWTTMAYHIYNSIYCKVMTTTVCDMQSKDMEAQCNLWRKLNVVLKKKGLGIPVFKGFLVDGVQVNSNVVCIVFGTGIQ
jgi:hypothetical protein